MVAKMESFQTPVYDNVIKTEMQHESDTNVVIVKDEPEDSHKMMSELKLCRICLNNDVRMLQMLGSEVQEVFEKIRNKKVEEDRRLYACYICYRQLQKCQQLVVKSQKSRELLEHIKRSSELNLNSITRLDRLICGLLNSLMITKLESLQIVEHDRFLKLCESDANVVKIKEEPVDGHGTSSNEKPKVNADNGNQEVTTKSIKSGKKDNIFVTQRNIVANKNMLSLILFDEKSQEQLVNNVKTAFICNDCGKTCNTKYLLIKHIAGHNPVITEPNTTHRRIQKSVCDRKYTKRKNKNKYLDFSCVNMSTQYQLRSSTRRHVQNKDLIEHTIIHSVKKVYKCQHCNFKCACDAHLQRHMRKHTGEKPYKCPHCSFRCAQAGDLKKHITRMHTTIRPFKCQYCDYKSSANKELKIHVRTHTGEKPFKCPHCDHAFTAYSNLKQHIRTHTDETPFKCPHCSFKCKQTSNLKTHLRIHTGDKPYKCPHCSFVFSQSSNLKRHIKIHTGEKSFKCPHCSYSCARNNCLVDHIKTHTREKPHKCAHCSYACSRKVLLVKHLKTHPSP